MSGGSIPINDIRGNINAKIIMSTIISHEKNVIHFNCTKNIFLFSAKKDWKAWHTQNRKNLHGVN
jgi:hypothetical protein